MGPDKDRVREAFNGRRKVVKSNRKLNSRWDQPQKLSIQFNRLQRRRQLETQPGTERLSG